MHPIQSCSSNARTAHLENPAHRCFRNPIFLIAAQTLETHELSGKGSLIPAKQRVRHTHAQTHTHTQDRRLCFLGWKMQGGWTGIWEAVTEGRLWHCHNGATSKAVSSLELFRGTRPGTWV